MTIEPLSSAMTYQAQNTQQAKPVQKAVENTDVSTTAEQTVSFDPTTAKIKEVDEKNGQGTGTNNQGTSEQQTASNEQIRLSNSSIRTCLIPKQYSEFMRQRTVLRSRL